MNLRGFAALVPVVAGSCAALWRRLQRAAVQERRAGLSAPSRPQAQEQAQIGHKRIKGARFEPAARLLVDDDPRRQIMRNPAPWRAALDQIAQAVEDLAQLVAALSGIFR